MEIQDWAFFVERDRSDPREMPALNPLASDEQIQQTPSRRDGIPEDIEEELCVYACQQIQQAGILLDLPQVVMGTAQVLFRRFWFVSSLTQFNVHDIEMGALLLASKLEEKPVRLRDMLLVFDYLLQRAIHFARHNPARRMKALHEHAAPSLHDDIPLFQYKPSNYYSQSFYDAKDALVVAEMQILKRLGFHMDVELPYARVINYLQVMGVAKVRLESLHDSSFHFVAAQVAWNYLTDGLQTRVYCLFPPHTIACAAIYLLTVHPNPLHKPMALPLEPRPWWELFDATRDELRAISSHILRLYDAHDAEPSGPAAGFAARVREMQGGLVKLGNRAGLRTWLEGT